jgi:hypothetical protein
MNEYISVCLSLKNIESTQQKDIPQKELVQHRLGIRFNKIKIFSETKGYRYD